MSQHATLHGMKLCTATHPERPNFSGHARGRKVHLAKSETLTRCNMRVDHYYPTNDLSWATVANGPCRMCWTPAEIKQHWYHPKTCPGMWAVRLPELGGTG